MLFSYISVFRPRIVCLRPLARRLLTSEISSSAKKKKKKRAAPRPRTNAPPSTPRTRPLPSSSPRTPTTPPSRTRSPCGRLRRGTARAEIGRVGEVPGGPRGKGRTGRRGGTCRRTLCFWTSAQVRLSLFFFYPPLALDALFRGTCI